MYDNFHDHPASPDSMLMPSRLIGGVSPSIIEVIILGVRQVLSSGGGTDYGR